MRLLPLLTALGLPLVMGWTNELKCGTYNKEKADQRGTFDLPCSTWNEVNCGNLQSDGIWDKAECQYNGQFPNGFRTAQLYADNMPGFYLTVQRPANTDNANRMAQLLIETDTTGMNICAKSSDFDPDEGVSGGVLGPECREDQLQKCFAFPATGNLELQIYCDQERGCENDISFKYKIMYSNTMNDPAIQANSAENSPEMWCMLAQSDPNHKAKMLYPSEMEGPPQEFPNHQPNAKVNAAGGRSTLSYIWCYSLIGISTLAVFFAA